MDKTWFTVGTILLCSFSWLSDCQDDCVYKECSCYGSSIMCENLNLKEMPQVVFRNLTQFLYLEMGENQIQSVPAGSLPPNLMEIDFPNNPLQSIDDSAFDDSATTLNDLYFSNIQFSRIPDAFAHLRSLTFLEISGANITDWNEESMKNIGLTMVTLSLTNVGMTTWPTWIQYFTALVELSISGNTFSSIPDDAFDALANNLTHLTLQNNSLLVLSKAFSKLTNLQLLDLDDNHIYDVSFLPQASYLATLSLYNNDISDSVMLSKALRPLGNSLATLTINNNQLTAIPDFSVLENLGRFDLSRNKISDPFSGAMPSNLYDLDLSYNYLHSSPQIMSILLSISYIKLANNYITEIHATDFNSQILSLDITYNYLTEITDTSFPENSSLISAQLNNNPITYISPVALKNLPILKELNLRSTKISRLPLGLSYLKLLYQLDVSDCPNLVCTCMESSLTDWFKSFSPESVEGDCGQTSVFIFFSTLSRYCPA